LALAFLTCVFVRGDTCFGIGYSLIGQDVTYDVTSIAGCCNTLADGKRH
jgi:hypothetical protein